VIDLQLLARWLGDDLDAGFKRIAFVDQHQVGLALFAEEFLEHVTEVQLHLGEGFGEAALGFRR
jgi:hypothetical protein